MGFERKRPVGKNAGAGKKKGKEADMEKKKTEKTEVEENRTKRRSEKKQKKQTSLRLATIASESVLPTASQQAEKARTGQTYVF